jgi:hypothetical protein
MNESNKIIFGKLLRYLSLLLLSLGNLYIFYKIFTPLTIYPTLGILKLIYGSSAQIMAANAFKIDSLTISLIPACIAGSAYYLLLILNLTTPMQIKTRMKSILFLFMAFLTANILRISVFSILALNKYSNFNQLHLWTWYIGSTIFVICLWFINVNVFDIKSIPVYSDFKFIKKSLK